VEALIAKFVTFEIVGWALTALLLTWLAVRRKQWQADTREDPRNSKIRQLDADLRLANRQLEEVQEQLQKRVSEFEQSVTTLQEVRAELSARSAEASSLREDLQDEVRKTRELRQELTDQAQERLREQVIRREAETQLEVVQAGSEAVMDEFSRLREAEEATAKPAKAKASQKEVRVDVNLDEMFAED